MSRGVGVVCLTPVVVAVLSSLLWLAGGVVFDSSSSPSASMEPAVDAGSTMLVRPGPITRSEIDGEVVFSGPPIGRWLLSLAVASAIVAGLICSAAGTRARQGTGGGGAVGAH